MYPKMFIIGYVDKYISSLLTATRLQAVTVSPNRFPEISGKDYIGCKNSPLRACNPTEKDYSACRGSEKQRAYFGLKNILADEAVMRRISFLINAAVMAHVNALVEILFNLGEVGFVIG